MTLRGRSRSWWAIVVSCLFWTNIAYGDPQTVDVKAVQTVEVESHYDDVEVVPGSGDTMRVEADESVQVEVSGKTVLVRSHDARLRIVLPAVPRLRVSTQHGDVKIDGPHQWIDVRTMSGDVRVSAQRSRDVGVTSLSGDLELRGQIQRLRARAVAGSVDVTAQVEEAELTSTSESVAIKSKVLPRRLECTTVSGDVRLEGGFLPEASMRIKTVSGGVAVRQTDRSGYRLKVRSRTGRVQVGSQWLPADREVRHTEGDGRTQLFIKTFNGTVRVNAASDK